MSTARLGDHVTFLSGFAFKSKLFNEDGHGLPVVRIRDVVRGHSETFYSGEYDDRFLVSKGDYLIGMDGEFNLARWQSETALLNQRVCKIDAVSDDVDRGYLGRFLPVALKEIEDATPFVTVKHLSVKKLNEVQIPLPPLSEQKRIAGILDAADALRAKRRDALQQLDILLQATFLDMFGDPTRNTKGFPVVKSGKLFASSPRLGTTKPVCGKGYLVVRVGELGESTINFGKCGRLELGDSEFDRYVLRKGDTVIARAIGSKAQLGKASFFDGHSEPVVIDSHVMRLRPDPAICDPVWFFCLITSAPGKHMLQQKGGPSAVQFNINTKQASDIDIPLPALATQRRFAAIVESVEQQKARMQAHLAELDALFASLQSRAFNGEL